MQFSEAQLILLSTELEESHRIKLLSASGTLRQPSYTCQTTCQGVLCPMQNLRLQSDWDLMRRCTLTFQPHSCIFWGRLMWQNSTFGPRFLFSIERSRPNFLGNRPRAWKTGRQKKRMKTVANKTCFEVPRKNELVHVVKTGFNWLYIMFFKLLHDTCFLRRVFGSLWTERKLLKIWTAIV